MSGSILDPRLGQSVIIPDLSLLRGTEIENAFYFPELLRKEWVTLARRNHIRFGSNTAHSLYFDTPDLGLFANGLTARGRRGGSVRVDTNQTQGILQVFPNQFAIKMRHAQFQAAADEIARRLSPNDAGRGIYPYCRQEVEGQHDWPTRASQLRYGDLPTERWHGQDDSVAGIIGNLIHQGQIPGVRDFDDLILQPVATTTVKRNSVSLYFDPLAKIDFFSNWPSPEPTPEMLQSGRYLCIEVALDRNVQRLPPSGWSIDDILMSEKNDFKGFKNLGTDWLFEYEIKADSCGPMLDSELIVGGYIKFGRAFLDFVEAMKKRPRLRDLAEAVHPMQSKATNAIGHLPQCLVDGPLYQTYVAALPFAP